MTRLIGKSWIFGWEIISLKQLLKQQILFDIKVRQVKTFHSKTFIQLHHQ